MSGRYENAWHEAVQHYKAGVRDVLVAEYRCGRRKCLLLHVWNSPNGPEFYAPAARVSDRYASAGQIQWLGYNRNKPDKTGERAGRLDDPVIARQWLWLVCDHVKEAIWTSDIRQDIAGRPPGDPALVLLPRDTPG